MGLGPQAILDWMVTTGIAHVGFERNVAGLRSRPGSRVITRCTARRLITLRRFTEADDILKAGLARHHGDPGLLVESAACAEQSGAHAQALARWEHYRGIRPDDFRGAVGISLAARALGRPLEAEAVIDAALVTFPGKPKVLCEAAYTAVARHDHEAALVHWRTLIARRKVRPHWWQGYIYALLSLGRLEEATSTLAHARRLHPNYSGLFYVDALIAVERQDWRAATAIARGLVTRDPNDANARSLLGDVTMRQQLAAFDTRAGDAPAAVEPSERRDLRLFMTRFESLGDDCEFGLVQRHCDAEPLGLLRFNKTSIEGLIEALANRFEGVGTPEQTLLDTSDNGEYFVHDRRYDFRMLTFQKKFQLSYDVFYPRICRRMVYLKDKLLSDLTEGEKIFVYKATTVHHASLMRLHSEIQAIGPARLLYVVPVTADLPAGLPRGKAGEAVEIAPTLFLGFISKVLWTDFIPDIEYAEWIELCTSLDRSATARGDERS